MKRVEVEILLSPEAEREFNEIQVHGKPLEKDWAQRYLEDLVLFPPEDWVDIFERLGGGYFKSDHHVPFDIQGKIYYEKNRPVGKVILTRFRLRKHAS
jgi:hypothetical protein